jgi:hypothetical protein
LQKVQTTVFIRFYFAPETAQSLDDEENGRGILPDRRPVGNSRSRLSASRRVWNPVRKQGVNFAVDKTAGDAYILRSVF